MPALVSAHSEPTLVLNAINHPGLPAAAATAPLTPTTVGSDSDGEERDRASRLCVAWFFMPLTCVA